MHIAQLSKTTTMKSIIFLSLFAFASIVIAAPQQGPDHNAVIVKYNSDNGGDSYNYGFETSNKISHQETGQLVNAGTDHESMTVRGQFSFVGLDGVVYTITYIADENGFQPQGAHLPH